MLYALTSDSSSSMIDDRLRLQHYTPMLHCALIAYASAFSDDPEIRSPFFRGRFAQHAKQWLDYEFERPAAALVRALALLSEYHCGIGEQSAGFMYMGMSIRAARSYKMMALELKHQYDLPAPHPSVGLPSADAKLDNQPWSDRLTGFPPRLVTKTFLNSCKLMTIAGSIVELLYDKYQVVQGERSVINLHQAATGGPIHDLSIKMVDRATHKIVQLLQIFEEQHGMRFFPRNMIYVIYECGLALLKEAAPAQTFLGDWAATDGENYPYGQNIYPFIHVWDNSDSPRAELLTSSLGLDLSQLQPRPQGSGDLPSNDNLRGMARGAHTETETSVSDATSYSGTPSSSTAPYPLPRQALREANGDTWEPYVHQPDLLPR
ncbi:hypothetical protein BN14_11511 [Rhizoctonia solani AG-1 IB]|uniref:Transcription factor domain-containing protein n=1 Tax=Thanatephorus cucumeris (strain AG1-IB / isolate 7/3/14) TaxID=1108050 RepID=M5CD36_THACB|nr:hypothetical protein BN14_11511 [Rhizoctonia solani AG-1 IB]